MKVLFSLQKKHQVQLQNQAEHCREYQHTKVCESIILIDRLKMSLNRLAIRLKANGLLSDISPEAFKLCMDEVIDTLFGSDRVLLDFIMASVKINELQTIHAIVKKKHLKYKQQRNNLHNYFQSKSNNLRNYFKVDTVENERRKPVQKKQSKKKKLDFESMPNEIIGRISEYLTKADVAYKLRRVSRQIAIVCLGEMQKISVGMLNMSEHKMTIKDGEKGCIKLSALDLMYSRYHWTTRMSSVYSIWSEQYGIPEQHQLLCRIQSQLGGICKVIEDRQSIKNDNVKSANQETNGFLLFDTRNVMVFDRWNTQCKITKFNEQRKEHSIDRHHNMMILRYFDIMTQSLNVVQFILYRPGPRRMSFSELFDYIESVAFVPMNGIDIGWYKEMKHCLAQMCNDPNHPKLCIYHYPSETGRNLGEQSRISDNSVIANDRSNFKASLFTFQLNPQHPWFQKTHRFDAEKIKYAQEYKMFHLKANEFMHWTSASIIAQNDRASLQASIQNNCAQNLNEEELHAFKDDIDSIINYGILNFMKVNPAWPAYFLKQRISKLFGNLIEPKHIELICENQGNNRLKWKDQIGRFNVNHRSKLTISCYFVLYDTQIFDGLMHENKLYEINIYKPKDNPYPHQFSTFITKIMIPYKRRFEFGDFIQYLFNSMRQSSEHILHSGYKQVLDIFYDEHGKINKKMECCVARENGGNWRQNKYDLYGMDDTCPAFPNATTIKFNLYFIRTEPETPKKMKLKINFVHNKRKCRWEINPKQSLNTKLNIGDIDKLNYIGLPLNVWLNGRESIATIIEKYLSVSKNFIQSCYRVKHNEKVMQIQKNRWNRYKPFAEFGYNASNDYLIFLCRPQRWRAVDLYPNADNLDCFE